MLKNFIFYGALLMLGIVTQRIFSAITNSNVSEHDRSQTEIQKIDILKVSDKDNLYNHVEANAIDTFEDILEIKDIAIRQAAWSDAFRHLSDYDIAEAQNILIKCKDPKLRLLGINQLAASWSRKDIFGATAYLNRLTDPAERQEWVRSSYRAQAIIDPIAASRACQENLKGDLLDIAVQTISAEWIKESPEDAVRFAYANCRDHEFSAVAFNNSLNSWIKMDVFSASDWVKTLSKDFRRDVAFGVTFSELFKSDIAAGQEILGQLNDDQLAEAIPRVAARLAYNDLNKAARWIEKFEDNNMKASAVNALIGIWNSQNPIAAETWVSKLPSGVTKDAGLRSLALSASKSGRSMGRAMSYADAIQDAAIKKTISNRILSKWLILDKNSASNWKSLRIVPSETDVKGEAAN